MFGSCHPPAPKIFFKFSGHFGSEGQEFLKWLRNCLDDADVTHIFKDKGKLNRIIKNHPIAHITCLFFFEMYFLFANFIFEKRTFLPFTRDCNNYRWLVKPDEKKPVKTNLIIVKNEQTAYYAPEISKFFSCYEYGITLRPRRIFFTRILKIDEQRFLYIDPCVRVIF